MAIAFNGLAVYHAAASLADDVRECIRTWGSVDLWSSGIQLLRSADSVAANIAEGSGRYTFPDQLRFYVMARASLYEVRHWLTRAIARNLGVPADADSRADEIGRMLNALIATTRRRATEKRELRN